MSLEKCAYQRQLSIQKCRLERFVHTLKSECLERLLLVGEKSLLKALREFEAHYLTERPHQGIGNSLVEPDGKLLVSPGLLKANGVEPGDAANEARAAKRV